jgi:hypothetical protein
MKLKHVALEKLDVDSVSKGLGSALAAEVKAVSSTVASAVVEDNDICATVVVVACALLAVATLLWRRSTCSSWDSMTQWPLS